MDVVGKLLLWVHFLGLAMGVAGGMGIGQVGPRMQAAGPAAPLLVSMLKIFKMAARTGLVLLLVTGVALIFVKYGGMEGLKALGVWFHVKMALVLVFLILIGFSEWGQARVARGDLGGAKVSAVSGPLTMLTVVFIVLTAVLAFY